MNILFLSKYSPSSFRHIAGYLAKDKNHTVYFLSEYQRKEYHVEEIHNICVRFPSVMYKGKQTEQMTLSYLRRALSFLHAMEKIKSKGFVPDIIFADTNHGCALHINDVFPQVPVIGHADWYFTCGEEYSYLKSSKYDPIEDFTPLRINNIFQESIINSCKAIAVNTQWQLKNFPKYLQKNMKVFHEGIDTDFFSPKAKDSFDLRTAWNLNPEDELITYVTRSLRLQGSFEKFLKALPAVFEKRPNAKLLLVGKLDKQEERNNDIVTFFNAYFKEYKDRIMHIHFATLLQYRALLQNSTLHVYSYIPPTVGISLLEAMSTGCLVCSEKVPAVEEFITHEETGLLMDFDSVEQISKDINNFLTHEKEYKSIKENARKKVVKNYTIEKSLKNMDKYIQQVMSK